MSHAAEVWLWDRLVGTVALEEDARAARFEYDRGFLADGLDVAPVEMPLRPEVYFFPELSLQSFHGLPGLLADSLPDKFGNAVLRAWVSSRGQRPESLTPIDRLCYTGTRGMGALEFRPALFDKGDEAEAVRVDELAHLAAEVLRQRTEARAALAPGLVDYAPILKVGSSAGGAHAVAL